MQAQEQQEERPPPPPPPPYVLICHHQTVGLATDAAVLKDLLSRRGWEAVSVTGPEQVVLGVGGAAALARNALDGGRGPPRFVVSLEHVMDPFPDRPLVVVPNPEWFTERDRLLAAGRVHTFWHKTAVSRGLLAAAFPLCAHEPLGWTSPEPAPVPTGLRQDFHLCLHVKGASEQKQTDVLLAAWRPHWPVLHVVTYLDVPGFVPIPFPVSNRNVVVHSRKLPRSELERLQWACGVHVCPSEAEGFGHYINEARAHGALVVTTDHPPMNELVLPQDGLLVRPAAFLPHRASALRGLERARIDAEGLGAAMEALAQLPLERRRAMGQEGQRRYWAERRAFHEQSLRVRTAAAPPAPPPPAVGRQQNVID